MFDNLNRLDLTAKDIDLIESALQTQRKILAVQSEAGGTGAAQKLNELRNLTRRIGKARRSAPRSGGFSFSQMLRALTCDSETCRADGMGRD